MDKELELEAEKHVKTISKFPKWNEHDASIFIAGATSKWVEKQKLNFAKTELEKFRSKLGGYDMLSGLLKQELEIQIYELEQKLKEL